MKTDGAVENDITGPPDAALRILAVYRSCVVRGIDFDISLAGLTARNGSESGPRPGDGGELNCAYSRRLHCREYGRSHPSCKPVRSSGEQNEGSGHDAAASTG